MKRNTDPLGILAALTGRSKYVETSPGSRRYVKRQPKPSPRLQRLIARVDALPFGGSINRYKNGWSVSGAGIDGGWTNNLDGVDDMVADLERYVADGVGPDGKRMPLLYEKARMR